jgi:hypothetical protein
MERWWWLAVASGVVATGAWRLFRLRGRDHQLMVRCLEAGLEFSPIDPFADTLWLPFRWLVPGRWARAENVVWSRAEGDDVRVFDLLVEPPSVADGTRGAIRSLDRSTCAVAALPFGAPKLEVRPRDALDDLAGGVTGTEIEMELEAFNRRFRVAADDRRFAVAFCDQRMMRALLALPADVTVAVHEDRMLLHAETLPATEALLLFEAARAIRRAVPSVLVDLYPPRPQKGRYEDRWLQGRWSPAPIGDDAR